MLTIDLMLIAVQVYGTLYILFPMFYMLCAGNVWLCNSGATLWLGETMLLIDLHHLLFWMCFSNGRKDQDVLKVIFLLNFNEVCIVIEDS